jgi:hypothetical protein
MHQAKVCFSAPLVSQLGKFKKTIAQLRMSFAKQEYPNKHQPIKAEASIAGFSNRDVQYEVNGKYFSMRSMIDEFETLISSITSADIIQRQQKAY